MKNSEGVSATLVSFFEWSLYAVVITMPIQTAACNISIGVAFVLSCFIFLKTKRIYKTISILPIGIFVLYTASLLYSTNIHRGVLALELGSSFLFVPLIFGFGGSVITPQTADRLLKAFSGVVLLICAISYVGIVFSTGYFFPSGAGGDFSYYDPFSRYAFSGFINSIHPTYLSLYLLFALVIVFQKVDGNVVLRTLAVGLIILFLLILSSKNQSIVFFAIISILLWRNLKLRSAWKVFGLIVGLCVLGFLGTMNDQIRYRFQTEAQTTVGDRIILWSRGMKIISRNASLGVGIGDSRDELNEVVTKDYPRLLNFNLHNQYLEFALSLGVVGLLAFLALLLIPIMKNADLTYCLFIMIIATASLTESILLRQKGLVFFLIFYGLLGLRYNLSVHDKQRSTEG